LNSLQHFESLTQRPTPTNCARAVRSASRSSTALLVLISERMLVRGFCCAIWLTLVVRAHVTYTAPTPHRLVRPTVITARGSAFIMPTCSVLVTVSTARLIIMIVSVVMALAAMVVMVVVATLLAARIPSRILVISAAAMVAMLPITGITAAMMVAMTRASASAVTSPARWA
jgi:hypothetical protein